MNIPLLEGKTDREKLANFTAGVQKLRAELQKLDTAILDGDTLTVVMADAPRTKTSIKTEGAWWNDAFGGTMGELMRALDENREPTPNGRDNLESIRTAQAMLRSSESGEAAMV